MTAHCPCPRCHASRHLSGLVGAVLEAEGVNAWAISKRMGTSSMARAKRGENVTIGVLAALLNELEYDLVLQVRKRQHARPSHQALPEMVDE